MENPNRSSTSCILATLPLLLASFAGCGPSTIRIAGTVVVPSALASELGPAAPAAVTVTYRVDKSVVPTWQKVLSVVCGPSSTDLLLPFEEITNLEDTTGCPAPGTVTAALVLLPQGGQCNPATLPQPQQLESLRPRAEASARVFEEWERRAYCDNFGEEYGAQIALSLARLQ